MCPCVPSVEPSLPCQGEMGWLMGILAPHLAAVVCPACRAPRRCVCVGVGATSSCSRNPGSASPARAGPETATWFAVAPPTEHGDPFLPGPGCWQPCQALAGMAFPAFPARCVAPESYLLLSLSSAGELVTWLCVRPESSLPPSLPTTRTVGMTGPARAYSALKHPPGSLARGVRAVPPSVCHGPGRWVPSRPVHAIPSTPHRASPVVPASAPGHIKGQRRGCSFRAHV